MFYKKTMFLEISQNSQENTCARGVFLTQAFSPTQVFSCEIYEISKNTFYTEHLQKAASDYKL